MIDGVLRHDTEMEVEKTYVDSHGQSEVAFAFCRMLGFELLPRLKAIRFPDRPPETRRPCQYLPRKHGRPTKWPKRTASRSLGLIDSYLKWTNPPSAKPLVGKRKS